MSINSKISVLHCYPAKAIKFYASIQIIIFLIILKNGYSQDPCFSQFYANPLYLNPALAGTNECSRLIFNYRNQWPSLPDNFITYSASADQYINAISGGVGVIFTSDNAGSGTINTTRISAIYSYHLKLTHNSSLNAGFEVTYHHQKLNWDKLVFSDMIDPVSGAVNPGNSGEKPPENISVSVPDFSTGLLLGIKEKYFIGIAAHHLAQSNLKYYSNSEKNPLYIKYTLHAGTIINLAGGNYRNERSRFTLSPNILFQHQQNSNQVNFGFYIEKFPLIAGIWYRHNISNTDGAIFLIGIKQKRFNFGYTYDLSLSKLKGGTGGTHEASLALLINCEKKRNKPGAIKCPEF